MSKIDKISHKIHILLNEEISWDNEQIFCITHIDLMLEQLRPYVELAEMIIDEDITKDVEFNDRKEYSRFAELYQQIKEQQ